MARPVPLEVRQDLLSRYAAGESLASLARSHGCKPPAMHSSLRRWAPVPDGAKLQKVYTLDEREAMIAGYAAGVSHAVLAARLDVTPKHMLKMLRKWGVTPRPRTFTWRRLALQVDYFEVIDTAAKAYWMGVLYADGCVKRYHITLGLKRSDGELVRQFGLAVGAETTPKPTQCTEKSTGKVRLGTAICLSSKRMADDLHAKGLVERKTYTCVNPLPHVPPELQSHFMRGFFDGDGGVHLGRSGKANGFTAEFRLILHQDWFEDVRAWYCERLPLALAVPAKTRTDFMVNLAWSGSAQVERILDLLYAGSTPETRLARKHSLYLDLKAARAALPAATSPQWRNPVNFTQELLEPLQLCA